MITVLRQTGHTGGSGAILARALGIGHANPTSVRRCRGKRYVINWGCSTQPTNWRQRDIDFSNSFQAIYNCINKARTLKLLAELDIPCLDFTNLEQDANPEELAKEWMEKDGKVVARHILGGHSGAGIEILRPNKPWKSAPLYTRYFKKDAEYRVHVAFGKIILIQQKKRGNDYGTLGLSDDDRLVRTNDNGWVFCIADLDCDTRNYRGAIEALALRAAGAVGLNHGAVDILVKHHRNKEPTIAVCEINTAPALRNPSTLNAYTTAFKEILPELV